MPLDPEYREHCVGISGFRLHACQFYLWRDICSSALPYRTFYSMERGRLLPWVTKERSVRSLRIFQIWRRQRRRLKPRSHTESRLLIMRHGFPLPCTWGQFSYKQHQNGLISAKVDVLNFQFLVTVVVCNFWLRYSTTKSNTRFLNRRVAHQRIWC